MVAWDRNFTSAVSLGDIWLLFRDVRPTMRNMTDQDAVLGRLPIVGGFGTHYMLLLAKSRFNAGETLNNDQVLEIIRHFPDRKSVFMARAHLLKSGLIEDVSETEYQITPYGNQVLFEIARRKEKQRQDRLDRTNWRDRQRVKNWRASQKAE